MYEWLEQVQAQAVVAWACRTFEKDLAVSTAFGPSGIVLLHLLSRVRPLASVFFVDTGFHFPETLALLDQVRDRFDFDIRVIRSDVEVSPTLHRDAPDRCCALRKVAPTWEALADKKAWMTGLRRDQGPTRAGIKVAEPQVVNGRDLVKVSPLATWTSADVWRYIRQHDLPFNALHDRGYPSIGCSPCTEPSTGSERSGRWPGCGKTECGMHL